MLLQVQDLLASVPRVGDRGWSQHVGGKERESTSQEAVKLGFLIHRKKTVVYTVHRLEEIIIDHYSKPVFSGAAVL